MSDGAVESEKKNRDLLRMDLKIGKTAVPLWLVLIFSACCLCSPFANIMTSRSSDEAPVTAAPQATLEPTGTSAPTNTPEPTNTPIPPTFTPEPTSTATATPIPTDTPETTNTPEPTHTPKPTNTPRPTSTPGLTLAEKTYRFEMLEITDEYGAAFTEFSRLAKKVSEQPTLLLDDDWKLDNVIVLATMMTLNKSIRELDTPTKFANVQRHMLNAVDHYDRFITLYAQGVDEINSDKINRAVEQLNLGNADIGLASEEMWKITN